MREGVEALRFDTATRGIRILKRESEQEIDRTSPVNPSMELASVLLAARGDISVGERESRSAKEPYPSTFQDSSYANPHAPRPAGQTWWSTRASPGFRDADATRAPVWDWQLRDLATSTVTFVFCEPTFFTRTDAPESRRRPLGCVPVPRPLL